MLLKKLSIGGILLIGIGLFIVANQAMAFSDEPCSQYNYEWCAEPAVTETSGSWTIALVAIDPVPDSVPQQWDWKYTITSPGGNFTGSNFVGFLLPDCCNTAEKLVLTTTSVNNFKCFEPSVGETVLNFGRYNNQAFVCKGTPDSTGNWIIRANTQSKTRSTIIIKAGKDVFEFEMAVPGCPLAPAPTEPLIGARTFSECSNFGQETITPIDVGGGRTLPPESDNVSVYVVRNTDRDGCISTIWRCIGHDCPDCTTADGCPESEDPDVGCHQITAADLPADYVLETSFLRTCPDETISVTHGSPFYLYRMYSGGILYQFCLDLGTYQWAALSSCF